nr:translation initiation factor IF-2-like [Anser cygnoides]
MANVSSLTPVQPYGTAATVRLKPERRFSHACSPLCQGTVSVTDNNFQHRPAAANHFTRGHQTRREPLEGSPLAPFLGLEVHFPAQTASAGAATCSGTPQPWGHRAGATFGHRHHLPGREHRKPPEGRGVAGRGVSKPPRAASPPPPRPHPQPFPQVPPPPPFCAPVRGYGARGGTRGGAPRARLRGGPGGRAGPRRGGGRESHLLPGCPRTRLRSGSLPAGGRGSLRSRLRGAGPAGARLLAGGDEGRRLSASSINSKTNS